MKYNVSQSFEDYLLESDINKTITSLNESPMDMETASFSRLANIIQNKLTSYKFDITDKNSFEEIGNNIFWFSRPGHDSEDVSTLSGHDFVLYIENDKILGASMFKRVKINNSSSIKTTFEVLVSTHFTKVKVPGLLYKMYSSLSRYTNSYIMSGDSQTQDSKKLWKRWLTSKENIKEIFGWHYKEKKFLDYKQISNLWCESDKCKERRIVIKFKG